MSGFWQVELDEQSIPLTGFSSDIGHFEYLRMPFGLKSSPITFCRLVDEVFKGLIGKIMVVYIDDIIILGKTVEEHLANVEIVLQRLQKAGLKVKLGKCSFLKKQVKYLGHTLTSTGVQVNKEKIRAIADYPKPKSQKEVKSFLGLASFYRSFIEHFAHIVSPLTDLLKENVRFSWGDRQEEAFINIKKKLSNPPLLAFPDFNKEFIIVADASQHGLGSALMQYNTSNGKLQPISYYSRKLSPAEINYSTTDKEGLSVISSLKHYRFIVYGHPVTVFTDHSAIIQIFKNPNLNGKRARWHLIASDYDVNFKFIPGRSNNVADALSRHISMVDVDRNLDEELIRTSQDNDSDIKEIKTYLHALRNNLATH